MHHCAQDATGIQNTHCRTRNESIWIKEFGEAEVANRTVDVVPIDPNVRSSEKVEPAAAVGGQPTAMMRNTTNDQTGTRKLVRNTVVETNGGASRQLDENQWQTMDVSLSQNATATATEQTQLTTNSVESCSSGLTNVAGHQGERADVLLPIEAMKCSANTIDDVNYQYEHRTGKLWGQKQMRCTAFQCDSTGDEKWRHSWYSCVYDSDPIWKMDFVRWRLVSIEVNQHERYDGFADTQALKVVPTSNRHGLIDC